MTRGLGWARTAPACIVRDAVLHGVFRPIMSTYSRRRVSGLEHLEDLRGPVLFVANHASHFDTPAILHALPREWRRRTAVAAAADYFYAGRVKAALVTGAFNTVPVTRDGSGGGGELEALLDDGWNLVVYAEGTRSRDGRVAVLRSGAAVLAAQRGLPIVPVYVGGTHQVMPVGRSWPQWSRHGRRPVDLCFGPAIEPQPGEHRTEVMERVRQFLASCGAETTLDKRVARTLRA